MTSADLVRADQQAMLIVGTFVAAQQDPSIWERFANRMFDDWAKEAEGNAAIRSSASNQAIVALGRLAAGRGTQPGVDATASGDNAQSASTPSASPAEVVRQPPGNV